MAKIVILDDHPDVCSFIQQRLARDGHDVRTSSVGDEAIDFVYLFKPDILITDWRLGDEYDGLEVAEAFRFANENIKTILITGHSIPEVEKRISTQEIFRTIPKPFSQEVIAKAVNAALKQADVDFSLN